MQDQRLKAYEQLWVSCRAIDDFRAKLLALLPLETGGGIFMLVGKREVEKILYGNKTPYRNFGDAFPSETKYMFQTVLDYGGKPSEQKIQNLFMISKPTNQ